MLLEPPGLDSTPRSAMINYRYRVRKKLGEGGSGEVYLCDDLLHPDIPSALKVLHADPDGDQNGKNAFLREASILSTLTHPNIVALYDFGVVRSSQAVPDLVGRRFLAMEFLQGRDSLAWASELPTGPIRAKMFEELLRQALTVLTYVHQEGIIHFDIKPENFVIVGEPLAPLLKLMDFGFSGGTGHSTDMMARGTLEYTAPEVLRGEQPDHRIDLYSLGATVFHLVEGRSPFASSDPVEIVKRAQTELPVFSHESWFEAPLLRQAVELLLKKQPAHRGSSALEVLSTIFTGQSSEHGRQLSAPVPSRIVGRASEQHLLHDAISLLGTPEGEKSISAITIVGPEGMGKSRLLQYAILQARANNLPVFSTQEVAGKTPFAPLTTMLQQLWCEVQSRALEDCENLRQIWQPTVDFLQGLATSGRRGPEDPERRLQAGVERIGELLTACSREFPFVLTADDIGRLDSWSCSVLRTVARDAAPGRVLVLMVDEPSDTERPSIPHTTSIELHELDMEAFQTLVETYLGRPRTFDFICSRLSTLFGTTPAVALQAIQTVRNRLPREARDDEEAARQFFNSPEHFRKNGLTGLLMNRFLQTPRERQLILLLLACHRDAARLDILERVLPFHGTRWNAYTALLELEGFVHLSENGKRVSLRHESLRQALYEMLADDRLPLHETIAETMESRSETISTVDFLELGYHWESALKPEKAAEWFNRAASILEQSASTGLAVRALQSALSAATKAEDQNLARELRLRLAHGLMRAHDYAAVREVSLGALEDQYQNEEKGKLLKFLGAAESQLGAVDEAQDHLTQAAALLTNEEERLHVHQELTNIQILQGLFREAEEAGLSHLPLARQRKNPELQALILNDLGIAAFFQDRYEDAHTYFNEARACYEQLGNDLKVVDMMINIGNALGAQGKTGEAIECWQAVSTKISASGTLSQQAQVQNNLGIAYYELRDIKKARECYKHARDLFRRLDIRSGVAYALTNLGELALLEGFYEEAIEDWESARKIYDDMESRRDIADTCIQLARLRLLIGDDAAADELLSRAQELIATHQIHSLSNHAECARGQYLLQRGDPSGAKEHLINARRGFEGGNEVKEALVCALLLAECAFASGEIRESAALAATTVTRSQEHKQPDLEAQAWYRIGLCARADPAATEEKALPSFKKSLEILSRQPIGEQTWKTFFELAREFHDRGHRDRTKEYLSKAGRVLRYLSGHFQDASLKSRYLNSNGRDLTVKAVERFLHPS